MGNSKVGRLTLFILFLLKSLSLSSRHLWKDRLLIGFSRRALLRQLLRLLLQSFCSVPECHLVTFPFHIVSIFISFDNVKGESPFKSVGTDIILSLPQLPLQVILSS